MGASFTLLTLSIVAIKLIRWHEHGIDLDVSDMREYKYLAFLVGVIPACATHIAAVFAIITFWLPPKPQLVFGIVALVVSGLLLMFEFDMLGFSACVVMFGAKPAYAGLDPLFTIPIIAQTAVAVGMGRKWHKEAKRSGL